MPKFSEEMEEKIIALFEKGKKNSIISRELGINRGALPKRRKEWEKRKQDHKQPEKEETIQQGQVILPDSAMSRLNQLHTLLGANSMEEMLETVYEDQVSADKYRHKYTEEFPDVDTPPQTFADIIAEKEGYASDLNYDLEIHEKGWIEDKRLIEKLKSEADRQYDVGYNDGKNDHTLLFPCARCGEVSSITSGTEIHRLIVEFLKENGVVHNECLPRAR